MNSRNRVSHAVAAACVLTGLFGCLGNSSTSGSPDRITPSSVQPSNDGIDIAATPQGLCGPGSRPEMGMQGRVSQEDHDSGRAALGFTCNTEMISSFSPGFVIGTVGGFKVERYRDKNGRDCAYFDSTLLFPTNLLDREIGVNVMDMTDPAKPVRTARLVTPAMLSPHESLVVSQDGGILAAVLGNPSFGPGVVDVYDLKEDCRFPVLKSSTPLGIFGHESGLSPDGKTFYSASPSTSTIFALDISNPSLPKPVWNGQYPSHGLSLSPDGNRAYVAAVNGPGGLVVLDTSEVQARKANPQVRQISALTWDTVTIPQNAIPITIKGKPYIVEIDEYSGNPSGDLAPVAPHGQLVGAGRIIDISDETRPKVLSNLRLAVHNRVNRDAIANDPGAFNPTGGYAGHYCNVPTRVDPTIVACSMILSGLRIFDISDPANPVEVAYFNAPVKQRAITAPAPASNWAMSSPSFVPERKEIWYTDGYQGFYVVRVTNGVWK
ncbi:MAG: LVIVD repeat-containing protein [Limnobacter sp.]|uniref:LVIVD repeat-containing protein n=1 Tax=Limnobacter sp. TaxID=2003368 RepID=UPI00391C8BB9